MKRSSSVGCRQARTGFTLVEMLLVITIVSILLTLVLPSLQQAREQERKMACSSQMRQVVVLSGMYYNDFRMLVPFMATDYEYLKASGTTNYYTNQYQPVELLHEGGYLPWDGLVGQPYVAKPYNPTWVNTVVRKASPMLCPSGVFYGNNGVLGYGNVPPTGTTFSSAQWDVMDLEPTNYNPRGWVSPWNGAIDDFTSYVPDTGTAHYYSLASLNDNGYNGYSFVRDFLVSNYPGQPPVYANNPPSMQLYWIEANGYSAGSLGRFNTDSTVAVSSRFYRVPHLNTLNFAAADGHVGSVARTLMVPTTTNAMLPFRFTQ